MNTRLIYLTIAMLGSTVAPSTHDVPSPRRALPVRAATPPCGPGVDIKNTAAESRCFELRTYTVRAGGSAEVLHARFRDHTIALFQKHGMTVVGFWQPVARLDQLVYILAYRSEEHTSELQSHSDLVCRLLLEKKKKTNRTSKQ